MDYKYNEYGNNVVSWLVGWSVYDIIAIIND